MDSIYVPGVPQTSPPPLGGVGLSPVEFTPFLALPSKRGRGFKCRGYLRLFYRHPLDAKTMHSRDKPASDRDSGRMKPGNDAIVWFQPI